MKKNIVIVLFILLVLGIVSYFVILKKMPETERKESKVEKVNTQQTKTPPKGIPESTPTISLQKAIESKSRFSLYFPAIEEDFNLTELLIKEFKKVRDLDTFKIFENKYGNQIALFTFLKRGDKDSVLKYTKFFIESQGGEYNKEQVEKGFSQIIESINKKGFYDGEIIDDEDYMFITLLGKPFDEKLELCKQQFSGTDEYDNCKNFSLYMSATKENSVCEKIENPYYKKWCQDSLELILQENE